MVNTAVSFCTSVYTCFILYQYFVLRNDSSELVAIDQFLWELFFLSATLTVVYFASSVTAEVCARGGCRRTNGSQTLFSHCPFQGRKTAEIVHDIINCCDDPDISGTKFLIQLLHLSQQVQFRHPVASCGLFKFDWTLLLTVSSIFYIPIPEVLQVQNLKFLIHGLQMGAAITTYLTIVLNFDTRDSPTISPVTN